MFHHILVPLDGSRLAESALSTAGWLARKMGAQITLIHVIEKDAPSEIHRERHLVSPEEATAYLTETSRFSELSGIPVGTHVHSAAVSDVARSIAEHSSELAPDLIVMCSHGKGGVRRLLWGVIAQQVINLGKTPVLIVHPVKGRPQKATNGELASILAPIDGVPSHEGGLPIAIALAKALTCKLHLLMVIPKPGNLSGSNAALSLLLPGSMRAELELNNSAARKYLAERAAELSPAGVEAETELSRGDPARVIIKAVRNASADLVVMGTHGRAGAAAFWEGSVAAQVAAHIKAPLLLVPLGKSETQGSPT